jgi:hypothetical protein
MPGILNFQSAAHLMIGVDPSWNGVPLGAPLQALLNSNTSNQWWYQVAVPKQPGYFWLHNAETNGVIGINPTGGVIQSGSPLQTQPKVAEPRQWWTTVPVPRKEGYFYLQSAVKDLVIDISSAGGISSGSQLQVASQTKKTSQWWTGIPVPLVAATTSLQGNNNYFLFGGYDTKTGYVPLNEVVVTITITEDLIGNPPFSFQLNCWSPNPTLREQRADGGNYDVWQQYGLSWEPGFGNGYGSFVENWPQNNPNLPNGLFFIVPPSFWNLTGNGTNMAAGTQIQIVLLQLNGTTGPVSGSLVAVGNGSTALNQVIDIIGQPLANSTGVVTSRNLAPIVAMQMNIVAYGTPPGQPSPTTVFTKGAGTIEYSSSTPMTVISGLPSDADPTVPGTGEASNCTYGQLPQGSSNLYVQTFNHS